MTLRIVAYNFLAGGSRARAGHWSRVIKTLRADLVLAQECRRPAASPGERYRALPDDGLVWEGAGSGRWGSAVLARSARLDAIDVPGYSGWITGAEVSAAAWMNGRPVRVFSIHCPAGEHGYVRTMREILDRLEPFGVGADVVLGGDFNIVVGYRQPTEKRRVSRRERQILERLSEDFGLVSCWQEANPGRPLAQTLRWTANRKEPYHCDGIFVPRSWRERLVSCRVVRGSQWYALSDHNPVIATFAAEAIPRRGHAWQ